jgi:hypothetical protein
LFDAPLELPDAFLRIRACGLARLPPVLKPGHV